MKRNLEANQLSLVFQGHLGLIVGPGVTTGDSTLSAISDRICADSGLAPRATYLDTCDAAITQGLSTDKVRASVAAAVGAQPFAPLTSRFARVRWGAVLSLTTDMHLEEAIRAETPKNAFRPPAVVIDSPTIPVPPRHIPILKLLGTAGRETLVISRYDYSRQRPLWRNALLAFLDLIKNAPVVCVGMTGMTWALADLLAELASLQKHVHRLVVLDSEPFVLSGEIDRMADPRTELVITAGGIGDVILAAESGNLIPNAIAPRALISGDDQLRVFGDVAAVVDPRLEGKVSKTDRQQLMEMLFAPTSVHWDPFVYKLDFARSISSEIVESLDAHLKHPIGGNVAVVEGAAATGKTVMLKRIALDLAAKDHLVLWLRPYFYPDLASRLAQLFKLLNKQATRGILIVQDDPYALGSIGLKDLGAAARASDTQVTFLVGIRSSEWTTREPAELLGPLKLQRTWHFSDSLDDSEWRTLETYLQTLQIARTAEEAHQQLVGTTSRGARDTLSMLFWLIPQTRTYIKDSIKQEYFRLGDQAGFRRVVLGQAEHSSELLKRAYEMVAVANKYRASVPVEVLVSALDVDYQQWLDATESERGAWGLLYAEDNPEAETFSYRTRNDVVSDVLIEALNGGSLARAGEVRVLKTMLESCAGSHPSYREFCERVLVGNETLWGLEYADGLDLYDCALRALPFGSKTLLHHKGIWMRKKGKKPIEALAVLEKALQADPTPYSRRGEADEHIYTSSAAALIDAVREGLISVDAGKEQALAMLGRARSNSFFNASAVHVYANLVLELAERIGMETQDSRHLAASALADVDRTVLVLEANPVREAGEDVGMLREARERIISRSIDPKEIQATAQELWDARQNQDGFCLASRCLLHAARAFGRGAAFKSAHDYCSAAIKQVISAGAQPSSALHDIRIQILYEWRIHAWKQRPKGGFIDWQQFYDDVIRVLPDLGGSPLYRYFEGIALSHLDKWNEASGAFAQVRQSKVPADLLWSRRDVLLDRVGNPREMQGTVRRVHDRTFIKIEEIGSDFMADREVRWAKHGEITLCFLEFSFGGWTATNRLR